MQIAAAQPLSQYPCVGHSTEIFEFDATLIRPKALHSMPDDSVDGCGTALRDLAAAQQKLNFNSSLAAL